MANIMNYENGKEKKKGGRRTSGQKHVEKVAPSGPRPKMNENNQIEGRRFAAKLEGFFSCFFPHLYSRLI
jgi:hypothetical protein